MTNRRRRGKGRTSTSKKSESPDKPTRTLNLRSRRNKKSESPERPEDAGSECSNDEPEEGHETKPEGNEDKNSSKEMSQFNLSRNEDDQKLQTKDEETGGSDGSWKVKSENGNEGGIPKLKLCLTRPPEMSSPTSTSDQNPSPKRRRRNKSKRKDGSEESEVIESPGADIQSTESDDKGKVYSPSPTAVNESDRKETAENSENVENLGFKKGTEIEIEKIENLEKGQNIEKTEKEKNAEKENELEDVEKPEVSENVKKVELMEKGGKSEILESVGKIEISENLKKAEVTENTGKVEESMSSGKPENAESLVETETPKNAEQAQITKSAENSENAENSETGDNAENSENADYGDYSENAEKAEHSENSENNESNENTENAEEPTPIKSGARKRRWGSSAQRTNKKPPVSISTDFLKEIIPEAKPLLMSEVQLSPNDEDEEGQLKDSEENLSVVTKKPEREKIMQSDESEKDYEEDAVESGMEEPSQVEVAKPVIQVKEREFTTFTRKVSVMPSNERLQKSPSPPRNKPSNILYIVNLVRPFTIPQLRELLARTGTITEDGFWIDKIKSKCYVKYETEEQAKTTRHALHGVRWPVSNPKQLNVDFGTEAAMKAAMEGNEVAPKRPIPSLFDKPIELKATDKIRDREKEREKDKSGDRRERNDKDKKDRSKHRDEEKRDEVEDEKDKKTRPPVEPLVRDRTVRRVTMPVREWDVGKNEDGFSPPPDGLDFSRHRDDRYDRRIDYDRDKRDDYDDRRRRDRDRSRRSVSGEPPRKSKKKTDEETPAKLLDDLFRKTKATPCIYWLPLTPEQIAVKEEMRRKHMAEHEKKVAELRKMQTEQSKRSSDKRRRHTRSRSRSRSLKK